MISIRGNVDWWMQRLRNFMVLMRPLLRSHDVTQKTAMSNPCMWRHQVQHRGSVSIRGSGLPEVGQA